jgi:hypothetical protein
VAHSREDRQGSGTRKKAGQQSGSTRPAERIGAMKRAPKKGTVEPKGTAAPGAAKKTRTGKAGYGRKVASKKPSTPRGR